MPSGASSLNNAPKVPRALSAKGNLTKRCTTAPMGAFIATWLCFRSAARSLLKPSLLPTLVKPTGSRKPKGAMAPTCSAGLNGGAGGASFPGDPALH